MPTLPFWPFDATCMSGFPLPLWPSRPTDATCGSADRSSWISRSGPSPCPPATTDQTSSCTSARSPSSNEPDRRWPCPPATMRWRAEPPLSRWHPRCGLSPVRRPCWVGSSTTGSHRHPPCDPSANNRYDRPPPPRCASSPTRSTTTSGTSRSGPCSSPRPYPPGCGPRDSRGTRSCAGNPAPGRPTRPARCSSGCSRAPVSPSSCWTRIPTTCTSAHSPTKRTRPRR